MADTATQVDALIAHVLSITKVRQRMGRKTTKTTTTTTTTTSTTTTTLASRERLRRHLLRILGSVLGSTTINSGSESLIIESTKKNLYRFEKNNKKLIRYQELVGRLRRSKNITNRWSILHLLKQLQGTGSVATQRSTRTFANLSSAAAALSSSSSSSSSTASSSAPLPGDGDRHAVDALIYGPSGGPNEGVDDMLHRARTREHVEPTRFLLNENMTAGTRSWFF